MRHARRARVVAAAWAALVALAVAAAGGGASATLGACKAGAGASAGAASRDGSCPTAVLPSLCTSAVGCGVTALAARAPDDLWLATATGIPPTSTLYHYDGASITRVASFPSSVTRLYAAAHDDLWIVLLDPGGDPVHPSYRVQRLRGGAPEDFDTPNAADVAGTGPGDVWLVGDEGGSHWDGATRVDYAPPAATRPGATVSFSHVVTAGGHVWATDRQSVTNGDSTSSYEGLVTLKDGAWQSVEGGDRAWVAFGADDLWYTKGGALVDLAGDTVPTATSPTLVSGSSDEDLWMQLTSPSFTLAHWDGHALTTDSIEPPFQPGGVLHLVNAVDVGATWGFAGDDSGRLFCLRNGTFQPMTAAGAASPYDDASFD